MNLNTPLNELPGIGDRFAKRLSKLNLATVEDLIYHFPFRYNDFSKVSKIVEVKPGEVTTIIGELWQVKKSYTRFGKSLIQAVLNDGSGSIELVWFNQPWLEKILKPAKTIQISGQISRKGNKLQSVSPDWEFFGEQNLHTGRLVPVYPETYGISSKWLRQKIHNLLNQVLNELEDPLPENLANQMVALKDAVRIIHLPDNLSDLTKASNRLAFDELFFIHLATLKKRHDWANQQSTKAFKINQDALNSFFSSLPFTLTESQNKVIAEIASDTGKSTPMNRLLQGEVGSGKTVVAAAIIYLSFLNKLHSVIMAPTEILAFQHFETLNNLLSPLGVEIGIYTGSRKFEAKSSDYHPTPDVVVGTHALLSNSLSFQNLGLVIIDEQQRFGVAQRTLMRTKGQIPHFLTMTATPIPRTVALTLYGDLDLSVIDQLPSGRKPIKTYYVPKSKRGDAYKFISKTMDAGGQAYVVTPLIEPSETLVSVRAAKLEFENLKNKVFPNLRLGLLHGRLKPKEKEQVLKDFKEHKLDILVSTSVVEVGVDVPNANIMVIEGADRFGLAQIHQLRGRVGRGLKQSYVLLFSDNESASIIRRLKILEKTSDGLKLSQMDLKIRGSGQVFGLAQSGRFNLKFASLRDLGLINKTKQAALKILSVDPKLDKHPLLSAKLSKLSPDVMPD